MADALCPECATPIPDMAYICPVCAADLADALHLLDDLADDLTITVTRQARVGAVAAAVSRGDDAQPLPFNPAASELAWVALDTLGAWARLVADTRGLDRPRGTIRDAAQFLTGHLVWLRHRPEAQAVHGEITAVARAVRRVVDSPPPIRFAGICPTDATRLYAPERAAYARCPECGGEFDVDAQHAALIVLLEDQMSYAAEIAQGLSNLGKTAARAGTIREWARRGRITARATDYAGRPLYRVGDVLDLLRDPDGRARKESA